jgi:hypothetical protein
MSIDTNLNDLINNLKIFFEEIENDNLNIFKKLLENDDNNKKNLLKLNSKIDEFNKIIELKEYLLILDENLKFDDTTNPYTYLIVSYLNNQDIKIFNYLNRNNIYDYYYKYVIKYRKEEFINSLRVGKIYDILDSHDKWYESEIQDIKYDNKGNIKKILVHYLFWNKNYDEWINIENNYHRIEKHKSKIWIPGKKLKIGYRVDALDKEMWRPATIIDMEVTIGGIKKCKVHWNMWSDDWDSWLLSEKEICQYGHKSKLKRYSEDLKKLDINLKK